MNCGFYNISLTIIEPGAIMQRSVRETPFPLDQPPHLLASSKTAFFRLVMDSLALLAHSLFFDYFLFHNER